MNNLNADAVDAEIETTKHELKVANNPDGVHAIIRLQTRMHAVKAAAALATPILAGEELRTASEKVDQWLGEGSPEQALRAHVADLLTDVDHFDGCVAQRPGDRNCSCLIGRLHWATNAEQMAS